MRMIFSRIFCAPKRYVLAFLSSEPVALILVGNWVLDILTNVVQVALQS